MQGGGATSSGPAAGLGHEIILQGFNWESHKGASWYSTLREQAPRMAAAGFSAIWLPPPSESVSPQGCVLWSSPPPLLPTVPFHLFAFADTAIDARSLTGTVGTNAGCGAVEIILAVYVYPHVHYSKVKGIRIVLDCIVNAGRRCKFRYLMYHASRPYTINHVRSSLTQVSRI